MPYKVPKAKYHSSIEKIIFDLCVSLISLIILSPVVFVIAIIIKLSSYGTVFFTQKRIGKDGKVFRLIKFRIMRVGAERQKEKLLHLNEADGPVFKIYNDPRYTKFGRLLARTGLDEIPQLINVIKGEMSLVGPRPLPVYEAKKLTPAQKGRELVKPGMTSSWVVGGTHSLSFKEWMRLDREYVEKASLAKDIEILLKTLLIVTVITLKQIRQLIRRDID